MASIEAVRPQAAVEQKRYARLRQSKAVTGQEYEKVATALQSAEAESRQAQATVNEVQATLDFATIRSPIDGTIIDKQVEVGDMVTPGQMLVTLFDPDRMQLVASVRESLTHQLQLGQSIGVQIERLEEQCSGTISEIVPEAQSNSRSFQVKVTGPCPPGIYSGMFGRILIPLGEEEVLVIPGRAVQHVGQLQLVNVAKDGRVARCSIRTGRRLAEGVEVLSGLREGEQVVVPASAPARRGRPMTEHSQIPLGQEHNFTNRVVKIFLESNLSIILILLAAVVGLAALGLTPREEDPQIIVPLADVYVHFPGHSAAEVEQLVTTPLEKILYQIDGVEYVYSMSRQDQAVITVRYYVGEDRERSLVKLYKKMDENLDIVPRGVTGWVVKPVEIDDVPAVTLTLASESSDDTNLRRVAEEVTQRLARVRDVSRAYVVGGRPRVIQVLLDPDRMAAHQASPLELQRAIQAANVRRTAGEFRSQDQVIRVEAGQPFDDTRQLGDLVIGVFDGRPVFLKDVATVEDGPEEIASYVRHGWGPGGGFTPHEFFPGTVLGQAEVAAAPNSEYQPSQSAVTIAIAKKKGSNAVWVANAVLREAEELRDQDRTRRHAIDRHPELRPDGR